MTSIDVPPIDTKDLRVMASHTEHHLDLKMSGSAEGDATKVLGSLLHKLHEEALRTDSDEVVVDLRDLEFMSSSCFKAFVSWLAELQDVDAKEQYEIRFLSDPNKHWQRRSLGALSCFAVDLVKISEA